MILLPDTIALAYEVVICLRWGWKTEKLGDIQWVGDKLLWNGGEDIKQKYLGDDMLLLVGLVDDRAIQLVKEETDKGSSLFHSLEKWNPQMQIGNRLVWALC